MIEQFRKPFFFAALGTLLIVLLLEVGAVAMLGQGTPDPPQLRGVETLLQNLEIEQAANLQPPNVEESQPGRGISSLAMIDGILLFTVFLMASSLFVGERIQGRVQGVATFLFSLLLVVATVVVIIAAVTEVTIMVALLLSPPFGTAAYMATYASFDRGGAAVVLSVLMMLKFAFVVLLILAQQRFLQNKGLVILIITSFVTTLLVSFLHGLVPLFLVSITDAVAAIIVAVLAIIWALVLFAGSIKSVLKAVGL